MSLLVHSAAALGLVSDAINLRLLAAFFAAACFAGQGKKIFSKGLVIISAKVK